MNRMMLFALFCSTLALNSPAARAIEVGDHAPCVELKDLQPNGQTIEQCIRTKAEGHSYVLLEFFTTSCGDCAHNLPKLAKLAGEIASTTTTRAVGIDRDEQSLLFYVDHHRDLMQFPVALDTSRAAKEAYGVRAVPTMFILDSDNKVIYKFEDVLNDEQVALIHSLVLH